jgi:histidinol-phosphate aminotransferase
LPSSANFLFARHPRLPGARYPSALEREGIYVRRFGGDRTNDFARVTIGTRAQMDALLARTERIIGEAEK